MCVQVCICARQWGALTHWARVHKDPQYTHNNKQTQIESWYKKKHELLIPNKSNLNTQ